jgi:pSer/pThr/pTyr-binding forkhead associated (FHA) protein
MDEPTSDRARTTHYALQWGTRHVALTPGENIIGRAAGALVSVPSSKVSRRHARILVAEESVILEDLGSKNGTRVGDERINGPVALRHGDRIVIGPVLLIFRASRDDATSTQAST